MGESTITMDPLERQKVPIRERTKTHYQLRFTNGLPPGTDTVDQLEKNPRLPRAPATPKRALPELPPISERKGHWLGKYLDQLDPETEYDHIIRVYSFHRNSEFMAALGYACVFVWLTATPAGAAAIHGGKVIRRGHQRFYETQLNNFHWIYYGSGSEQTKAHVEQINKLHATIWKRAPGTFSQAWDAQSAVILLSSYESILRKMFGAKNDIHPQLKKAWPEWGERLTGWFRSEPTNASQSFGINYPRDYDEILRFGEWLIDFDMDEQRTEEDKVKGHETAEAFILQFNELWFPRCLHFLGRAILLTCVPKKIRRKQRLEDPNPLLEYLVQNAFRLMMNFGDAQPDPALPEFEDFYHDLETRDMSRLDALHTAKRDAQEVFLNRVLLFGTVALLAIVVSLKLGT